MREFCWRNAFLIMLCLAGGGQAWARVGPDAKTTATVAADRQTTSAWSPDLYGRFDHKKFAESPAANMPIVRGRVDRPLLAAAIFYATNEQRSAHGRKPFQFYGDLAEAAAGHSESMARQGFFSHVNPYEKDQRTVADRLKLKRVPRGAWGENIALNPMDERGGETYLVFARKMVAQWMNSRGHRANILRSRFNYLGCGVAAAEMKGFLYIYATQAFSKDARPEK